MRMSLHIQEGKTLVRSKQDYEVMEQQFGSAIALYSYDPYNYGL